MFYFTVLVYYHYFLQLYRIYYFYEIPPLLGIIIKPSIIYTTVRVTTADKL